MQAMGKLTFAANASNRLTLALYGSPTVSGGANKYSLDPRTGQPEIRPDTEPGTYSATARRRFITPLDALLKWNSEMSGKKVLLDVTAGVHREQIGTRAADGAEAGSSHRPGQRGAAPCGGGSAPSRARAAHCDQRLRGPARPDACVIPKGTDRATMCPVSSYLTGGPGFLDEQLVPPLFGRRRW